MCTRAIQQQLKSSHTLHPVARAPEQRGIRACRGLECTGSLIGPKHVVTAAHCVFDINDSRQYVSSLDFAPGESSQNSLPYGTAQWSSVRVLSQFTSQVGALCSAESVSVSAVPRLLPEHQDIQTALWLLLDHTPDLSH